MRPQPKFLARARTVCAAVGLPAGLFVRAATADSPVEIMLYEEIGMWGITASDFAQALKSVGNGPVRVRINSPGGDVFDGYAIYNALLQHTGTVETVVDGVAASAASYIALAGAPVTMAETSMMMIHNASCLVWGDRNDMASTIGILTKIDGQLAAIYAAKTGKTVEEMATMMDAETWFTSAEAKDAGLCDAIQAPPKSAGDAKASADVAARLALGSADPVAALRALLNPEPVVAQETIVDSFMRELRARRLRLAESI
jgi:ATP-dependent Clp protease, protease subunit